MRSLQCQSAYDCLLMARHWKPTIIPFLPYHRQKSPNASNLSKKASYSRGFSRVSRDLQYPSPPYFKSLRQPKSTFQRLPGRTNYSTAATKEPTIHHIFETVTGTWQYIISDPSTRSAAIIDPVLDYNPVNQAITTDSADALLSLVQEKGYRIERILETHAHADHLTAASYIQKQLFQIQGFKPPIGIGKRIEQVQRLFGQRYGIQSGEYEAVFDKLFEDDESFQIGELTAKAIHLPGHTPDHLGYQIGDNVFCGDSLFHVDIGTARCDFPGGDAKDLFQSSRKLLSLDSHVKIWPGHDYPPEGRDSPIPWMSVADHRKQNKHVGGVISEKEFVSLRMERDAKLNAPRLLHQSLQVNIRAGQLPKPLNSGHRMLHLPLKLDGLEW
ncbi:beta-lactamase-like protein [Penicillium lividum]|nr:beta-lactamase-like protein [Penicillium lividum]